MNKFFITGIGTEVGKTVISAIVTEALEADYWKPVQAGDLEYSDSHKVKELISNPRTIFHPNSFALKTPMSPHAAAEKEGIEISEEDINEPQTQNDLVIEGAGGLLVPLNDVQTIADLIKSDHKVILVSRHYLGSINHTLLTVEALKTRNINCIGIIFNGAENRSTEEVILKMTKLPVLLRVLEEKRIDREMVKRYAQQLKRNLRK